ncbi:uncharacterized SAM-binding protein YcdF (DUF218 family) [Murinocardiopsis flavida]|uniref:Uncharacterized SAM-binding protein YcdF (DUF218 family) n=1 Tax=Murinocardiopsis flavida TaxID=645275 RepID=A0A2P8D3P2_9ACTN|nr:ElyC/SanA/YdcF family protein [Murinocardiopsis flavida]PSK91832.1 uncharacterized SAM-binding protein YcdF (DUF218 family) [Murinocardiopsis flavida]
MPIDVEARACARVLWDFHAEPMTGPGDGPADLILGLGSHDLRVAHHAALLWADRTAPLLMFTGDRGRRTNGGGGHARWERPEADVFAAAAREVAAIPDSALLLERGATNTSENFARGRDLAAAAGLDVRRAVVTAKPYMGRRALAAAAVHWPGVQWTFRAFPGGFDGYPDERYSERELVHFVVGDLQRLDRYAERGWSAPVAVPEEVRAAQRRLIALGYTEHLVPD